MKKILFVALGATLLAAGCQKTEVINRVGDKIDFATDLSKLTKATGEQSSADQDGMENLRAQNFRVWAYYVAADENTGAAAKSVYDGMADSPVTHSYKDAEKKSDIWAPNNDYYWPGKGKDLMFFAVSGVAENDVTVNIEDCTLETEFTVNPQAADTDLMVADFVQQNQGDTDGAVNLTFNHALSKVEFLFKTTDETTETIYVQKLEVGTPAVAGTPEDDETPAVPEKPATGLYNEGKLTVSTDVTAFGTEEMGDETQAAAKLDWDLTGKNEAYFMDDYKNVAAEFPEKFSPVGGGEAVTATDEDKQALLLTPEAENFTTWLMIPQDIYNANEKTGETVTITYLIDGRQFKAIFPLYIENDLVKWDKNQYIRYTVTLSPNKISFNAKVEPWKEYDVNLDENKAEITPKPETPEAPEA